MESRESSLILAGTLDLTLLSDLLFYSILVLSNLVSLLLIYPFASLCLSVLFFFFLTIKLIELNTSFVPH